MVWRLLATITVSALLPTLSFAIDASDRYRSPRNPERRIRSSTELIVLHTTEAAERGSLVKLCDRGEAHYCVTEAGTVYRIVDRDREAFHAGRSMWNGKEDVDKFSIGIECVGHHDKAMPEVQIAAIKTLVKELQSMYRLSDDKVVCHSHVAYGAPNKWHRFKHRGRKRCGMLFAMPSVRRRLGLTRRPAFDPDTKARRLKTADEYLRQVLYGSVDTMAVVYAPPPAQKPQIRVTTPPRRPHIRAATPPPRPQVRAAAPLPKPQIRASTPSPTKAPPPAKTPASVAQLKSQGYHLAGTVSVGVTASKIAGAKWNAPSTYYTIRDKVIPGSRIDASHIEKGMQIWMKK